MKKQWQDKRLSFNGPIETLSLSIKMLEGIWKPDTFFYNGKKSYLHTITTPNKLLRIKKDGSILYSVRYEIIMHSHNAGMSAIKTRGESERYIS